ncbi:30S ribosomal protein S1 [Rubripirellula amarantea]|uniref:Small ribosomal subunit protein bS1 n=1 Tax=Rubripirellula amarantea TaxID=2527999 RepID=A0A5C5WQ49_9BACT|nr:30S ribosomal protein S1 [Rubripirellula amarantea]TWT52896.1 30S ribosomal protein S1 [Rubripirellula amarantea]
MVNRNLIRNLDDDDLSNELAVLAPDEQAEEWLIEYLQQEEQDYAQGEIVDGKIVEVNDEWVLIDVGFKSEGTVSVTEWGPEEEQPVVGGIVKVLIEEMEDELGAADDPYGMISLSKKKAESIIEWERIISEISEGQVVTGTVTRKIKGGLLVNIGVPVFLPGSQVDIRRPGDIGDFIGRVIQAEVLKIDDTRRNIVISRRSLIERQREEDRAYLMKELETGQIRKGIVKNIADFGAFVDLGGIDGLLHITDMAWERIGHPTEMVSIDQEIDVKVLHIDREKQKIALGLKQKDRNPWENIETKYPVESDHKGEVVNVMSYGAFVKLEPGIEGLVHISEMSWTKRVNHPSELVNIGDAIEVRILGVDPEGQQLSLGMKQTQKNPWDEVIERYPEGQDVKGKVRNLTNYGAFIELEEGIDGLLHVSDMSWTRKIGHPSEMLEKGQEIECRILSVDESRRRIALGLKQLDNDPWDGDIPDNYLPGQLVKGKVTKITNFGVFIGLEDGLEGLLHISELAEHKVEDPEEVVKVGQDIEVKVLRVDTDERKIGLSLKRVGWGEEQERAAAAAEAAEASAGMPNVEDGDLKGGLGSGEGPLFPTGE